MLICSSPLELQARWEAAASGWINRSPEISSRVQALYAREEEKAPS
jgi:hypothetical protein